MILSKLALATTTAETLGNLVLVTPQKSNPLNPQDPNSNQLGEGILFHYEQEHQSSIESDITDHAVEENNSIVDNIGLRPETITVSGMVGELNNVSPLFLERVKFAANKLTVVENYVPELSSTAIRLYNDAFQAYQISQRFLLEKQSSWGSLSDQRIRTIGSLGLEADTDNIGPTQNKQQKYYQQFYANWRKRVLFTVQTPWAIFENMAIQSMRTIQSEGSRDFSEFQITFKMIRFASSITVSNRGLDSSNFRGRSENQASPLVDKGPQSPKTTLALDFGSIA